ncbi:MAG: DUF6478 family protein [Pseudomonadota bacterium]
MSNEAIQRPMPRKLDHLLERALFQRSLSRWSRLADAAPAMPLDTLKGYRARARVMKRHIDRLLHQADHRLALPVVGSKAIRTPLGTDWSWRPDLWSGPVPVPGFASVPAKLQICDGATVFHDCRQSELTVRQIRNVRETDLAPFGLRMDVFRFDGSYLSLVIDLPNDVIKGLGLRHVIRLACLVEMEKPLEIFARINVKHGPNVEQIVRELPVQDGEVEAEFDLSYTNLVEKRAERIWIDLIFEGPEMNQIVLRDVTLARRPRAEL